MTEKDNKVPKREAMSLSIWVCFDEGKKKKKKRARGAFHMSMPGGSDVSLSIHGLQQHAKRRRKVTTKGEKEEETATEQTRM